jgi:hypothetical protein
MNRLGINKYYQQHSSRLAKRLWTFACAIFAPTLVINSGIAEEANDPQLDAWYQVEVVIFTQQGYAGSEQPPRKLSLDFPENILQLLDTDYIGNNYPPIDIDATEPERTIPVVKVEDPALAFATPAFGSEVTMTEDPQPLLTPLLIPGITNNSDISAIPETQQEPEEEKVYIPEYEKPFIKLDRELRDLNDSARALDRRAKYNVVFHQAWRFGADKHAADPWVIIKAGKQFEDRFEIEGSLRFYKSRFLHFQSDLWLATFANTAAQATWIELPTFPAIPEPSLSDDQDSLKSLEVSINEDNLENFFADSVTIKNRQIDQEEEQLPLQSTKYPISNLWIFDQSKRLEEQQSYYLDHPKMGILVTIKPHEVQITNPLEEEPESEVDERAASN